MSSSPLLRLVFAALVTAAIGKGFFSLHGLQALVFTAVLVPVVYLIIRLHARWMKWERESFADAVVQTLVRDSRETMKEFALKVDPETIIAQQKIEAELRASEAFIVRSKVRFISRPTKEDIQSAVEDDAVIVVRVPIPARWRETLSILELQKRNIGRLNAVLQELELVGGHPRVMLLSDTCESRAAFTEKVYERFGA